MKILALESSAKAASVAVTDGGRLLAQYFQNNGLTHSRTLLKMTEELLSGLELKVSDIDAVAVAIGPGSFTGVRIGVAAAKGLALGAGKPTIGVSSLLAMAHHSVGQPELICCAMDARRGEIYNALFRYENGKIVRLCDDRAITLTSLVDEVKSTGQTVRLTGDGAMLCADAFEGDGVPYVLSPAPLLYQTAWGVAAAAADIEPCDAAELEPFYLRLSQAERERMERLDSSVS